MTETFDEDVEAKDAGEGGYVLLRHPPSRALVGLVTRITGYRETVRRPIRMTEAASLVIPIIISFGEPFEIALNREPCADDRFGSFTAGLTGGPVRVRSHGAAHCLQIDLTPLGAYRFFGRPMHELTERMVRLDDLGDRAIAIRPRLTGDGGASEPVTWAYSRIVETGGAVRIGAIAERLEWSRKHLAARFREEVGISPKMIARIARFNRAQAMAGSGGEGGWADVAAACGYADQAHLVREFSEFAGATPVAWRAGGSG